MISSHDILTIFISITLVLIGSFVFYLPLLALLKDQKTALPYSIPFSVSIQILLGYLFYSTSAIKYYPLSLLTVILIANGWAFFHLRKNKYKHSAERITWKSALTFLLVLIPILYTRFFDSFTNIGPGNPDTLAHVTFFQNLKSLGVLGLNFYAPGFHVSLFPLLTFLKPLELYRFTGAIIGLLVLTSTYFLLIKNLKNQYTRIFFLLISCLFIFNPFTLQTISLWPSALSFIYFAAFLSLTFNPYKLSDKAQTGFFILFSAALAVTVPYFYVQLIPSLFFVLLIVIFFKRAGFDKRSVWKSFLFACLGLLLAFAHVYFQTQVRVKNDAFPEIQFVDEQEGNLISKNNRDFDFGNIKNPQLNKILTSSFFQKNILPLYGTGIDILRAKGIRSPLDLSQIKTYGMILISVIVFMYGIKKKKFGLVLFSGLIFFYGVSLQTGILELSFYRGRIGWYFSMLTPILLAYFLDEFEYKEKVEYALYGVLILAYGLSFVSPPTFNRHYCPGLFDLAKEITYKTNKTIKLLTNESDIQLYSEQIQVYPLNKGSIDSFDEDYIIFEKKFCSGISDRDSKVLANDLTYQAGLTNQQSEKRKTKALFDSYKQSSRFTGYTPFWQNDYFEVWAK